MSRRLILGCALLAGMAPAARADYAVLRNGQRLHISGYEQLGANVRLQLPGGSILLAADELVKVEPEEVFPAAPAPALRVPYAEQIRGAALKYGVDEDLIVSVIAVESSFDPRAVSPKFARGLMQILPETAARFGVTDILDPAQNIDAGTRYLKELLALYNQDLALALAAYNAGPDRIVQYGGVPPFPETRSYVKRVTGNLRQRKQPAAAAPMRLAQPRTHSR